MTSSTEPKGSDKESFRKYCAKRMSVQHEFILLFEHVLQQAVLDGKDITPRHAFDLLNDLYFNLTGRLRYKTYERFLLMRMRRDHESVPSARKKRSYRNKELVQV